jgi:hypothetical protein
VGYARRHPLSLENAPISGNRCQLGDLPVGSAPLENAMKIKWATLAVSGFAACLALASADPVLARGKHKAQSACADRPHNYSWHGLFFNPAPQPNGCAPPVYAYGKYIGQDPDPFIRQQLLRDPATGYAAHVNN